MTFQQHSSKEDCAEPTGWQNKMTLRQEWAKCAPPDVPELQLPEAFTTSCAGKGFWELQSKNTWRVTLCPPLPYDLETLLGKFTPAILQNSLCIIQAFPQEDKRYSDTSENEFNAFSEVFCLPVRSVEATLSEQRYCACAVAPCACALNQEVVVECNASIYDQNVYKRRYLVINGAEMPPFMNVFVINGGMVQEWPGLHLAKKMLTGPFSNQGITVFSGNDQRTHESYSEGWENQYMIQVPPEHGFPEITRGTVAKKNVLLPFSHASEHWPASLCREINTRWHREDKRKAACHSSDCSNSVLRSSPHFSSQPKHIQSPIPFAREDSLNIQMQNR